MRIVSQDRKLSINFDQCEIWTQDNVIYRRIENDSKVIGIYQSEDRAMEIFEDMHKAFAPVYSISDGLSDEQIKTMLLPSENVNAFNVTNAGADMCLTTYDNYVYYMPEN